MRPHSLAEVVERARGDGDWEHHLREFLDAFYAADGDVARQAAFIADEPGLLGRPEADAFLGGAGEHLARRWGLPIPGWVRAESRYLTTALFVPDEKPLRGYLMCVSPVSFRARLIFTGPDPLQRARFPYHRGVITMPPEHGFPKGEP
ncbi:hypothetical protein MKK67_30135 [Methylobacterium sp. J-072]|uniref:hypothetical protein n=1 Tax=Methylobacterium sp. J-072 TaxID=2836651 RepID=UPI001FB9BB98|nr:hypothetical protein [Methylobacterium sp. J-072]MCJ2096733.1 hypothetical protein [Methylobacterium sp. J-072]